MYTHSKQNSLFPDINQIETKHKQAYRDKLEVNILEVISGSSEVDPKDLNLYLIQ
jgi:hypothetical protein